MTSIGMAALTILVKANNLFAMASRPNPDPNAPPPPAWVNFFPLIFIVTVFYFLLIRPQMKQRKERDQLLNTISKGDKIITQGGLIATVVNINGDILDIKLNEDTKVQLKRTGVLEVLGRENKPELVGAQ